MKKIAMTSLLVFVSIVTITGNVYANFSEIHCKHFVFGIPLGAPDSNDLIIREIYALSSNDSTKFADWVAYQLDPGTVTGDVQTKRKWKVDPYLAPNETLEPDDYTGAHDALKTDRGHQAPLASFKGTPYWHQTNYLSNITPQKSNLNQGPWRVLEERVRKFVRAGNTVHVITGPLYEKEDEELPQSDEEHIVPSGYWKIIIFQQKNDIMTAAFIFSQNTARDARTSDHLVSIDEIERRCGLDFLWELPDDIEVQVESRVSTNWAEINF